VAKRIGIQANGDESDDAGEEDVLLRKSCEMNVKV
jgi:hypothetical protein